MDKIVGTQRQTGSRKGCVAAGVLSNQAVAYQTTSHQVSSVLT